MKGRTPIALLVIAVMLGAVACSDQKNPTGPKGLRASLGAMESQGAYVATPAGLYDRSCVHQIPNGAHVGLHGRVTRSDGSTFQLPACTHPAHPNLPQWAGSSHSVASPSLNGWLEWDSATLSSDTFGTLTADWKVPAKPSGSYSGQEVYYTFPGLENSSYIIQPVLQYGYNGDYGGSFWSGASWRCNSGSDCLHGDTIMATTGDSIHGSVQASSCVNGTCTWTIVLVDVITGSRSDWTADDNDNYTWASGGGVEVYSLTQCSQFPQNGVFYTGVATKDLNGTGLSPTWYNHVTSGLSPSCDFSATHTATTVNLYHNVPSFSVGINGTGYISSAGNYTWSANPSGGSGSYSYAWDFCPDGGTCSSVGSDSTYRRYVYANDTSFTLDLTAVSPPDTATASHHVKVCIGSGCPLAPSGSGSSQ